MKKWIEFLRNKEKEMGEMRKRDERFYALTGKSTDVMRLLSMLVINPGLLILFVYYMAGVELSVPVTYLVVDSILLLVWWRRRVLRKRWLEEEKDVDRTDILLAKIEELGGTD